MECYICKTNTNNQSGFCSKKCRNTEQGKQILIETRGYPDGYQSLEIYQKARELSQLQTKVCIICNSEFEGRLKDDCCSKECIEKNRIQKSVKTKIEKYGYIGFQNPTIREKSYETLQKDESKNKRRKTNLERYGNQNVLNSKYVCDIRETNNLERYGVTNPFSSNEVMKKIWIESLGVDNPQKDRLINQKTLETRKECYELIGAVPKESCEKTCLARYGSKTFFGSEMGAMSYQNLKEKYNWTDDQLKDLSRRKSVHSGNASKISLKVFIPLYKWLRRQGFEREDICFGISGSKEFRAYSHEHSRAFLYDFTILSKKLVIEFNGCAFHARDLNSKLAFTTAEESLLNDQIKNQFIKDLGYQLLVIWDDIDLDEQLEFCKRFIQRGSA